MLKFLCIGVSYTLQNITNCCIVSWIIYPIRKKVGKTTVAILAVSKSLKGPSPASNSGEDTVSTRLLTLLPLLVVLQKKEENMMYLLLPCNLQTGHYLRNPCMEMWSLLPSAMFLTSIDPSSCRESRHDSSMTTSLYNRLCNTKKFKASKTFYLRTWCNLGFSHFSCL